MTENYNAASRKAVRKKKAQKDYAPKRDKRFKVGFTAVQMNEIERAWPAKKRSQFAAEVILKAVRGEQIDPEQKRIHRDVVIQLSRIGSNVNQIAKACNTMRLQGSPLDAVNLALQLGRIEGQLKAMMGGVHT